MTYFGYSQFAPLSNRPSNQCYKGLNWISSNLALQKFR